MNDAVRCKKYIHPTFLLFLSTVLSVLYNTILAIVCYMSIYLD